MFRFTIRDVLWLTVVVGLGVGWWADHRANRAARVENALYEERASISAEILKNTIKCLNAEGYEMSVTPDRRVYLERLSQADRNSPQK